MLSILIPVYNFNVKQLVENLSQQAVDLNIIFEILLIDDCSDEEFKHKNRRLCNIQGVKYFEVEQNLGRSKVRNKLADFAQFQHLLFLDCDSAIISGNYLKEYINLCKKAQVVYGGRLYANNDKFNPNYKLHWLHGINREQLPAIRRNTQPNRSFQTNNFLIHKDIFTYITFNEKILGYGHEDTLFGYELAKNNIQVLHIDNPVIHLGLETNEEFLRKTKEGIKNLKRIMRINANEKHLISNITLLAYYKKLCSIGLDKLYLFLYTRFEHVLRKNLLSAHPKLLLFDLYKLGYLCSLDSER